MKEPLAIDFTGWTLRERRGEKISTFFGCTGTPPAHAGQRYDWSYPLASRTSLPVDGPLLGDAWAHEIKGGDPWFYSPPTEGNKKDRINAREACGAFISSRIFHHSECDSVFAVPNLMSVEKQESFLSSFRSQGVSNIPQLIWRPVAVALWALSAHPDVFVSCQRLIVVDADGPECEVTQLHIQEQDGRLVPVRDTPTQNDFSVYSFAFKSLLQEILPKGAFNPLSLASVVKIMSDNPADPKVQYFKSGRWCFKKIQGVRPKLQQELEYFIIQIQRALKRLLLFSGDAVIVYHGWPFQYLKSNVKLEGQLAALHSSSEAVVNGAYLHILGQKKKTATYLDTIPGLYLPSEDPKSGLPRVDALIPRQTIPGGTSIQVSLPKLFTLSPLNQEIRVSLIRGGESKWRSFVYKPDTVPEKVTKVRLKAEMASGQGAAKLILEENCKKSRPGPKLKVVMNWEDMKPEEPLFTGSPSYWPMPGRVFDEDPEPRNALKKWLSDPKKNINTTISYHGKNKSFGTEILNKHKLNPKDPSRGLLGSDYIDTDKSLFLEIDTLATSVYNICKQHNNMAKFLNYLYVYAPYPHRSFIRDIFKSKNLVKVRCWNHAYAPGYQFCSPDDFNLLLDWIEAQSEQDGYPNQPEVSYTQKYFWSCFRCLCYYPETIRVGSFRMKRLLEIMISYAQSSDFPQAQDEKFLLCLILFALRIRELEPDFLNPEDSLFERLVDLMVPQEGKSFTKLDGINFPPGMLAQATVTDGGLTEFVLRFLKRQPDKSDIASLNALSLGV